LREVTSSFLNPTFSLKVRLVWLTKSDLLTLNLSPANRAQYDRHEPTLFVVDPVSTLDLMTFGTFAFSTPAYCRSARGGYGTVEISSSNSFKRAKGRYRAIRTA
jgi:hypothetical protein